MVKKKYKFFSHLYRCPRGRRFPLFGRFRDYSCPMIPRARREPHLVAATKTNRQFPKPAERPFNGGNFHLGNFLGFGMAT